MPNLISGGSGLLQEVKATQNRDAAQTVLVFIAVIACCVMPASHGQQMPRCEALRNGNYCAVLEEGVVDLQDAPQNTSSSVIVIGLLLDTSFQVAGSWLKRLVVSLALADIECAGILKQYKLSVLFADSGCNATMSTRGFIELANANAVGFIGPECSIAVNVVGQISPYLNAPMVTPGAEDTKLSDVKTFGNLLRMSASGRLFADGWLAFMSHIGWSRVTVIHEIGREFDEFVRLFEATVRQHANLSLTSSITVSAKDLNETSVLSNVVTANARMVITMVYPPVARRLLCKAIRMKLMSCCDGSQKLLFVWPSWVNPREWFTVPDNETLLCNSDELLDAVDGSFFVSSRPFAADDVHLNDLNMNRTVCWWKQRLAEAVHHINSTCPLTMDTEDFGTARQYAGYIYDSVWLWAKALQLLEESMVMPEAIVNKDSSVRKAMTDVMRKVSFTGVSGEVTFQGTDRVIGGVINNIDLRCHDDLSLGCLDTCTRDFLPLSQRGSRPLAYFSKESSKKSLEVVMQPYWASSNCSEERRVCMKSSETIKITTTDFPAKSASCRNFRSLESALGSCAAAISLLVVTSLVIFLLILYGVSIYLLRQRYRRKYLVNTLNHLKQFGMTENEAYVAMSTDTAWEINREKLVVNRKLGEGAFGTVFGADAFDIVKGEQCSAVAVKMLRPDASDDERVAFYSEIQLMKKFKHTNIVSLIGVCTTQPPMCMVMELMLHGDLRHFLLSHRHLAGSGSGPDQLTASRLTSMARDIARGLQYLHQVDFVHRDLAARNCLVTMSFTVKIGDFGLSRRIGANQYYRLQNKEVLLPVRWMARESLLDGVFSSASDVWSYGVVVWEIITMGSMPYPALSHGDVIENIKNGETLEIPTLCPELLRIFLRKCWELDRKQRPSAKEIVETLTERSKLLVPCADLVLHLASHPDARTMSTEALLQRKNSTDQVSRRRSGRLSRQVQRTIEKFRQDSALSFERLNLQSAHQTATLVGVKSLPH